MPKSSLKYANTRKGLASPYHKNPTIFLMTHLAEFIEVPLIPVYKRYSWSSELFRDDTSRIGIRVSRVFKLGNSLISGAGWGAPGDEGQWRM